MCDSIERRESDCLGTIRRHKTLGRRFVENQYFPAVKDYLCSYKGVYGPNLFKRLPQLIFREVPDNSCTQRDIRVGNSEEEPLKVPEPPHNVQLRAFYRLSV